MRPFLLALAASAALLPAAGASAAALPAASAVTPVSIAAAVAAVPTELGGVIHEAHHRRAGPGRGHARGPRARHGRRALPAACIRFIRQVRPPVVGRGCLRRFGVRANLPYRCERSAFVAGRWRSGFAVPCLRRAGFRFR